MRLLRKIEGVTRLDHVRSKTVRERLRLEPVLKKMERRRECWKEKVESRKRSVVEKVLMGEGVERDRKVGLGRDGEITSELTLVCKLDGLCNCVILIICKYLLPS